MSDRKLSRGAISRGIPITTLEDLRDAISADPVLGPREKEARRSAIQTFCKWQGIKEPSGVPADYVAVKRELACLSAGLCGVSKGRFANVRLLINRSFLAYRADLIDTRKTRFLPEWDQLFRDVGDPSPPFSQGPLGGAIGSRDLTDRDASQAGTGTVVAADRAAWAGWSVILCG